MSNWRTKASKVFKKNTEHVPVQFAQACPCGSSISGERRNSFQRVICKECGESFFILPIDVYPQQKLHVTKVNQAKQRSNSSSENPVNTKISARISKGRSKSRLPPKPILQSAVEGLQRVLTPFRVVLVAIVILFSITGFWILNRQAGEQAVIDLKNSSQQAYVALESKNLETAAAHFQQAVDALDLIGREDQESLKVRQMARELKAATNLVSLSLLKIIEESQEKWQEGGSEELELHMKLNFRDSWIVMETNVFQIADNEGKPQNMIDFPFMVNNNPVKVVAPQRIFKGLALDENPRKVVFAAQIQDCRPSQQNSQQWVIDLKEESAFLWANYDNYRLLGFDIVDEQVDQNLQHLFEQQAKLIGVAE